MSRKFQSIAGALAAFTVATSAQAAVVFSDNFDSYAQQLSVTNAVLASTGWTNGNSGTVDIIAYPNPWGLPASSSGQYVDLGGSNDILGRLQTIQSFAAGNYVLSFSLAGTQRIPDNTTTVKLGNWSQNIFLPANGSFQTYTFGVSTTGGVLSFEDTAQSPNTGYNGLGNVGNLLDNVVLSTAAVPEPSTWALMIAGFAVVGLGLRRRAQAGTALPA